MSTFASNMIELSNISKFDPAVKWSGSKRSQCFDIVSRFPTEIDIYYEPFLGGASVLRALLQIRDKIRVKRYVASDLNEGLMELWKLIKERPVDVYAWYSDLWYKMNSSEDQGFKRSFFNDVRKRYNETHDPLDFMFLDRTCFNGLIRYNASGDFNSPFHLNRDGIHPDTFLRVLKDWAELLQDADVEFRACSYETIQPEEGDFAYLDPPYAGTSGQYYTSFDNVKLFDWMRTLKCGYALSYDGRSGNIDNTYAVPKDLYDEHVYLKSGNSSFKRIKETDKGAVVFESLYLKSK